MTITERPHGYARYKLDRCRCYVCCFAVSEYSRRRDEAIAAGTWRVDADQVRVHLRALGIAGMGYKRVAKVAGINISTVGRILYGRRDKGTPPPATTRHDLAQRLLAVELDLHPNTPIEATGTVRRAQALVTIGHTIAAIATQVGWTPQNFSSRVVHAEIPNVARVEVRTAQAVGRTYDQWSMTAPTGHVADRTRRHARRLGWFPPLAWDDEHLDDPAALPCLAPPVDGSDPAVDELALQHAVAGHRGDLDRVTRVELVRRLTIAGWPADRIAAMLGVAPSAVYSLRTYHRMAGEQAA